MRRVIRRHIRRRPEGLDLAVDVNAVIAVNRGDDGAQTDAQSVQHTSVVQGRAAGAAGDEPQKPGPRHRDDTPQEDR
jgi:hypothetical protein